MGSFVLLTTGLLTAQLPPAAHISFSKTVPTGSLSEPGQIHAAAAMDFSAAQRRPESFGPPQVCDDCNHPFVWIQTQKQARPQPSVPEKWDRLFPECWMEELYDLKQLRQEFSPIKLMLGAWHWAHLNNDGPGPSGYGLPPNLEGTYYWYVLADVEMWNNEGGGFVKSIGAHLDYRLREEDRFRPFFHDAYWAWEAYFYADTEWGKLKAGQVWKRFGLDWDGTFWGNIPYFDGFKLDPDWGFSWEHTWNWRDDMTMNSFVQYFVHEDGINGSIAGAGPDSIPGSHEKHFGVVRLLPIWKICDDHIVGVGFSGMMGQIENEPTILAGQDDFNTAWAVDIDYNYKKLRLFAEYLQSRGIRSPAHYVNGAPSDRIDNLLCGFNYKIGPATFRFSYSAGWYHNPGGFQDLYVPGVTVALTKNIDFYCEYVRWNTRDENTIFTEFEDGYQFIINWRY